MHNKSQDKSWDKWEGKQASHAQLPPACHASCLGQSCAGFKMTAVRRLANATPKEAVPYRWVRARRLVSCITTTTCPSEAWSLGSMWGSKWRLPL